MRLISIVAIAAAALATAAFETPRESGAYLSTPAYSAEACARVCAEDSLCMAWAYDQNICALRATIPANMSRANAGLSPRAPRSLIPTPAAPTTLGPTSPQIEASAAAHRSARPVEAIETTMLLGGPDEESASLRPSFGASR